MDPGLIQRAVKDTLNSHKTVAFTGAGISVLQGKSSLKLLKKSGGVRDSRQHSDLDTPAGKE